MDEEQARQNREEKKTNSWPERIGHRQQQLVSYIFCAPAFVCGILWRHLFAAQLERRENQWTPVLQRDQWSEKWPRRQKFARVKPGKRQIPALLEQ